MGLDMISLNIEREMKLEAITFFLRDFDYICSSYRKGASDLLDILDNIDISTQEAWMAEERLRDAEMTAEYSRETC